MERPTEHLDILAITESWLTGDERDNRILSDLRNALPDYVMHHVPRPKRGGGVAVLMRRGFDIVINPSFSAESFEQMDITISSKSSSIRLYVIYRPYPSKVNKLTVKMFFDEFSAFMETCTSRATPFVIAGDFNFHMDVWDDREATIFRELLDSASFDQHVDKPTHRCGHMLDLVITRSSDSIVSDLKIDDTLPSDHFAAICKFAVSRPPVAKHQFRFRKLRDIDLNAFKNDIAASSLVTDPANDVESLSTKFDNVMSNLLDCHAPEISKTVSLRPHAPWYEEALREEKRERRRCERQFCKSGLEVHKRIYREQCKKYSAMLEEAKSNYHKLQLKDCDQKQLFRKVDKMCSAGSDKTLPSHDNAAKLTNEFAEFFADKIGKVRDKIDNITLLPSKHSEKSVQHNSSIFSEFCEVSEETIHRIIMKSPSSTCFLDSISTWLLKECLPELLPSITRIVNGSLLSGIFPTSYKFSNVTPLIKKPGLDADTLSNYRPISNLKFVSKVVERAASAQLQEYMFDNGLYGSRQSAYRKHFSTETALVRVQNDILRAIDQRSDVVLVLLDLSAAFDTVDHQILLQRLRDRCGVHGDALAWCKSYLCDRRQSVVIGDNVSATHVMDCSVPQGSVAGPFMFTVYAAPLEDLARSYGVKTMIYADDTQLYLVLDSRSDGKLQRLEDCVRGVKTWTAENRLLLNDSKTEVLHLTSRFIRNPTPISTIKVGDCDVDTASEVRNLGVMFDQYMTSVPHVNKVCRAASLAISKIGRIQKYIDRPTAERLVHAFVTFRLDANNSLLLGLPSSAMSKLQRVQNSAVRLVLGVCGHRVNINDSLHLT